MLRLVSFRHDVRLARTIGFRTEKRIGSFICKQKFVCEHVDHGKNCHAWYLCFAIENVAEPIGFKEKLCFKHIFSVRKPMMRRPFMPKTERADAMRPSGPGRSHDFLDPLAFEPLSP